MISLGINAYHADASAVLLKDGILVAAAEEERFNRIKHCSGFPARAILSCLKAAGVEAAEIDGFGISRKPRAHLWQKVRFALGNRFDKSLVLGRARKLKRMKSASSEIAAALSLDLARVESILHHVEHHPAHLASAFFVSPFEEAAVCAIDGFGDFVSTSWGVGAGSTLTVKHRTFFPHSLGQFYLALTQFLGFRRFGDEFKVMGLAPYGDPDYAKELRQLIRLRDNGEFEMDLSFFRHVSEGVEMTWDGGEPVIGSAYSSKLAGLLGPERKADDPIDARHEAIAASLQLVFEEAAAHVLRGVHQKTGLKKLCLAGGCAMNSVFNGKIREQTPFTDVFVQPASGDNGTSLGAAFAVWNGVWGKPRRFTMEHSYWGPEFSNKEIRDAIAEREGQFEREGIVLSEARNTDTLCRWTAERIAAGKVVGWFQGRMEWAARALGNRSILADPRRADMRDIINVKIKLREKFRPFAPSIVQEALGEYFVGGVPDPFMIQVYPVRPEKRAVIPAVTHVDGSGRLQTVSRSTNPIYWQLIKAFESITGVPVLLNTSFNENEPIVHKPSEAMDCFLRTHMDVLVLGSFTLEKAVVRPIPKINAHRCS